MSRTSQHEKIAKYLLLLLVTEGDIETPDNTEPSEDATRQLIKRGKLRNDLSTREKIARALKYLRDTGQIVQEGQRNLTNVLRAQVSLEAATAIKARQDEIIRAVEELHDIMCLQQPSLSFDELERLVQRGFETIIATVESLDSTRKRGWRQYQIDPHDILKKSLELTSDAAGTILYYLSRLGLVYRSPYQHGNCWTVRTDKNVQPDGLKRVHAQAQL